MKINFNLEPNLEHLERPIFRSFEISNIRRMEDELCNFLIFEFFFQYLVKLFEHSRYIIYKIENLWDFEFSKLQNFENLLFF